MGGRVRYSTLIQVNYFFHSSFDISVDIWNSNTLYVCKDKNTEIPTKDETAKTTGNSLNITIPSILP